MRPRPESHRATKKTVHLECCKGSENTRADAQKERTRSCSRLELKEGEKSGEKKENKRVPERRSFAGGQWPRGCPIEIFLQEDA
jgi:hypothetical protein